jgi:CxxC-x17-CxxC domain-containing protein
MQDKTLKCQDCGREFVFSASEQEFFAQKGFTNQPLRCPECRAARKAQRGEGGNTATGRSSSGYTSIGHSSGGYTSAGSGYGGSNRKEMFSAVCAQCGKSTQVPFEPRNGRPVYCSNCYTAQRPNNGNSFGNRQGGGGRRRSW